MYTLVFNRAFICTLHKQRYICMFLVCNRCNRCDVQRINAHSLVFILLVPIVISQIVATRRNHTQHNYHSNWMCTCVYSTTADSWPFVVRWVFVRWCAGAYREHSRTRRVQGQQTRTYSVFLLSTCFVRTPCPTAPNNGSDGGGSCNIICDVFLSLAMLAIWTWCTNTRNASAHRPRYRSWWWWWSYMCVCVRVCARVETNQSALRAFAHARHSHFYQRKRINVACVYYSVVASRHRARCLSHTSL